MNRTINLFSSLVLLFLFTGLLTSCNQKEEMEDLQTITESNTENEVSSLVNTRLQQRPQLNNVEDFCFDFHYPVAVRFPDGQKQELSTKASFSEEMNNWYVRNPQAVGQPDFIYPITVITADNVDLQINSPIALNEVFQSCLASQETDLELCFDFVYPITVLYPDGQSFVGNNLTELEKISDEWHDNNPNSTEDASIVYPIEIIYPDGETLSIGDVEKLQSTVDACDDSDFNSCYELVFPFTIHFPGVGNISVNSSTEIDDLLEEWYENNPNSQEYPDFVYPFELQCKESSNKVTVDSSETLTELIEEAYDVCPC